MSLKLKRISFIILATIWISFSEFLRNELLFKSYWLEHYQNLGIIFPSEPINGAVWGIWSLFLACLIYIISRKFNLLQTIFISWFAGFILMWLVTGNLAVLPFSLLYFAVPLSWLEVVIAALIINRIR